MKKGEKTRVEPSTQRSEAGSTVGVIRGLLFRCEAKGGEHP